MFFKGIWNGQKHSECHGGKNAQGYCVSFSEDIIFAVFLILEYIEQQGGICMCHI
jgi:hypothetical protein